MDKKTIDKLFQGQITIKNIPLTEKFVQLKTDRSPYDVKVLNLLKPNDDALYSYCKYKEISDEILEEYLSCALKYAFKIGLRIGFELYENEKSPF